MAVRAELRTSVTAQGFHNRMRRERERSIIKGSVATGRNNLFYFKFYHLSQPVGNHIFSRIVRKDKFLFIYITPLKRVLY